MLMTEGMPENNTLWIVAETEVVVEPADEEGRRSSRDIGGGFDLPRRVLEPERMVKPGLFHSSQKVRELLN